MKGTGIPGIITMNLISSYIRVINISGNNPVSYREPGWQKYTHSTTWQFETIKSHSKADY